MVDSSIIMASPFIIMNTMDMAGFFVGYHIYCFVSGNDTACR